MLNQYRNSFMEISEKAGSNIEFSDMYYRSNMKLGELIRFFQNRIPANELVKSVGYHFRYTIEAAQIVVNDAIAGNL